MSGFLEKLYRERMYPAMSHPSADPAVNAVAARLVGLEVACPANAAILEIGCASGHHLLSLASRWPESRCVGVDFSAAAVAQAVELAKAAGISNAEFHAMPLQEYRAQDGPYDFIVAHGFFSWVPDEVKAALLEFCGRNLSERGIAAISFNVEAGWLPRMPVIAKARAIQQAGGVDEMTALEVLKTVTEDAGEGRIIDDMLAKGVGILPFDDFAPVNDPWPLDRFVGAATARGLRWLGESVPGNNSPERWSEADEKAMAHWKENPLALHHAADMRTRRTFRTALFCRKDAEVKGGIPAGELGGFFVRWKKDAADGDREILEALRKRGNSAFPVKELAACLPGIPLPETVRRVMREVANGNLELRSEPMGIPREVPEFPRLSRWRMVCASRKLPVVDAWLMPCAFPDRHVELLAKMDGTRSISGLAEEARKLCPELDFHPWLRHLAGRGMFGHSGDFQPPSQ